VEGKWRWASAWLAVLAATTGGLAALAGTGLSSADAGSTAASSRATTLAGLVTQAKDKERSLLVQVQKVREQVAAEKAEIGEARNELATLISVEYEGAPNGTLALLASPSLSAALNTQITLSRFSSAENKGLQQLVQSLKAEQANQQLLAKEQKDAAITEARLEAAEIVAAYEAANPPAPVVIAAPARSSVRAAAGQTRPTIATPTAAPTPVPTPVPTAVPTAPPTPPPPPTPAQGPFTTSTDLAGSSGITLTQIQQFLQGSPLEADSAYFLQAEATDHVSAIYLVSDAVLETGFGTSQLYLVKHNLFGFGAYDANPFGDGDSFPTDQDCISFVAWYVSVYYLTPPGSEVANQGAQGGQVATGQFYNGPTTAGMNIDYASDPSWASKIAAIGDQLQAMPG
jgi:hypothetical protein